MTSAIRPATMDDVPRIRELVIELADYERAADQVKVTQQQLQRALFGETPAAYALVAEAAGELLDDGAAAGAEVVGFALYFLNFSTWEGVHGIYLEDLYVRPSARGTGLGKALLTELCAIAAERGYARVEWSVLDWNEPSIEFYRALGAVSMDEWTGFRLTGEALQSAAASARGSR